MNIGCSFFELMVGLARRLSFEAGQEPRWWFHKMMDNLGFSNLSDAANFSDEDVRAKLDKVIWRTYDYNGVGGLFPLKHADKNQRAVELWYQFNAYLLENEYV
jgi:hypothetical protein